MGRAHRSLRAMWEVSLADLEVTAGQGMILRAVSEHPGGGPREVARHLATDPMNAKRMLDHLEDLGLLTFTGDASDRRRKCAHLSERGERIAEEVVTRSIKQQQWVETLLGPERSIALFEALRTIEGAAQAAIESKSVETPDRAPSRALE